MKKRFFKKFTKTGAGPNSAVEIKVYVPNSLFVILNARAQALQMPVSRLVCYAIDNEITEKGTKAFEYPVPMPETEFVVDAYIEEARKILNHITKYGPASADMLMLSRRDFEIPEKHLVMLGIRELLNTTLVTAFHPIKRHFRFHPDYKVIGVKRTDEEKKQAKIDNLKRELAKLQGEFEE